MNADPRRPDKVQRYVPKNSGKPEDNTPDYMNIMGQPPTTANAPGEAVEKHPESSVEPNLQVRPEDVQQVNDELTVPSNAANVIPTSPQYGVAIISNTLAPTGNDMVTESVTIPSETLPEVSVKAGDDVKDIHTTPSRNDRFKVVKIASLEPFKRGRWKCMDYVDEAPPANVINANANKAPQSVGNAGVTGGVFFQTQSLPQQQIQQMLMSGGFTNGTQFFPGVQAQLIPQGQYFYPQVASVQSQTVPQQVTTSMPAQFINNQPYFSTGVVANSAGFTLPQGYSNIQYVPIQTQNSAFVPTTQAVHLPANFQQSQSYAGQPTVSQANINQSMVNGHNYPQHTEPLVQGSTMPNQPAKNVILNSQSSNSQPQQNHVVQNQQGQSVPAMQAQQYQQPQSGTYPQQVPTQQTQTPVIQATPNIVAAVAAGPTVITAPVIGVQQPQHNFDASNVYTNPQFAMSVNSLTVLDPSENNPEVKETNSVVETVSENSDDPNKNNPVVNAIDNKIEQAMDLVKSHLMYTVREEVEVLKEKIAELMEKIQQLETENNYLRSQIPKNQSTAPPASNSTFSNSTTQPQNVAVVNPSPTVLPQNSNPVISNSNVPAGAPASVNPPSQNQAIPNNLTMHQSNKEAATSIQ